MSGAFEIVPGDCLDVLRALDDNSVDACVTDPPAGIGFMNKEWDDDKGGRDQWVAWLQERMTEVLRVLKPGGYALVWTIPRTSHWTAWAVENAGFEVRDVVAHLFGTGFPKSRNIGLEFDKRAGVERPVIKEGAKYDPSQKGGDGDVYTYGLNAGFADRQKTAPVTPLAKEWDGWGTALKPSREDWILARKPLDGTIAHNVETWRTGGLNIDATRLSAEGNKTFAARTPDGRGAEYRTGGAPAGTKIDASEGRWPANTVVGDDVADDLGPNALYFYCPKPGNKERDAGLEAFAVKSGAELTGRKEGQKGVSNPRAGAGRGGNRRNTHPTVKAVALMRYLITLITPPGGLVVDPFTGSGSTGIAAVLGGFDFLGIEGNPEYVAIAEARISHAASAA
jgi:site-specific DNA-methyltransferase (adenine-specific)